jgi:signal transduction histidine kinase/CheY-like chemotaxis protein
MAEGSALAALLRLAAQQLLDPTGTGTTALPPIRFSILMAIGQALAGKLELEPLMETVYREVGRLFDTTNFYIALYRPGAVEWHWAFHVERGQREAPVTYPIDSGLTGYILRTGQPLFLPVYRNLSDHLVKNGVNIIGEIPKSWMGVPLIAGEVVVGAMAIQSYEVEDAYDPQDLELFITIASQIAVAIQNAQLYEDTQRRAQEMETLAAIGREITASLDLETVLEQIVISVRSMLTRDTVAIFLDEGKGNTFRAAAVAGLMAEPLQATILTLEEGILGSIIASGVAEIIDDSMLDPRAIQIQGTPEDEKGEKIMAVPLRFGAKAMGVLAAWRKADEPPFERVDLAFLEGIGLQASVAIRNAQLFGQSRTAQAEAENASRAKSSFLASMSHELRTPLNAILLYSELLMDEVQERGLEQLGEDLDRIQGAGKHLLGLIDDILDLSKIEAGRMAVFLEDCHVPALLTEIAHMVQPLVSRNRNQWVMESDPSIEMIHTDEKKLRQTICNLISNAAKFTQDGMIRLHADTDPEDPHRVRFTISDTGIGMNPEQMGRIFHEFSQAEESTSRTYGGTGLGLTLCRRFVDLLGGEIRVQSTPGQGTSFIVCIPGLPAPADPDAPSASHATEGRGIVLVIDDDALLREAISRMLLREGFKVVTAGNGLEGLKQARSAGPDIITLDIAMPGFDGWQVLTRLKADEDLKHIPVVVVTVLDDRAKGFALEAADYLQKPINREQLIASISRILPEREVAPILVVEDDEATREGLRRILEAEGLRAISTTDGLRALDVLRHQQPSLILLDLMMPEMDGFQLLEELQGRGEWRDIPVVVLTAAELTVKQRERLCQPQIHQILRKGAYSRVDLIEVVRRFAIRTVETRESPRGLA